MNRRGSDDLARIVVRDPIHWIAFGLGTGLLPKAPGTWGSLATAIVFWFVTLVDALWLFAFAVALLLSGI